MAPSDHDWVTLHRLRFATAVSALERRFDAPTAPSCWRFCPVQQLGPNGLPTWNADTWCGLGIHESHDDALAMIEAPADHLPFLSESVEHWHALAVPVMHHGKVNWRGTVEENTAIRVVPSDPKGPLVVITSAGFFSRAPDQIPRIADFLMGVQAVVDFYGELDGNVRRDVFNGGFDGRDGFTVSLWRDDKSMKLAAYAAGEHRSRMDQSRDGSVFDYSSFTRARIVAAHGSWDGDPLAQMA